MRFLGILLLSSSAAYAGTLDTPVVGGTSVPMGQYQDVVAVIANDAMCSGTLIAPDVVLTAGHCIETHPIGVIIGSVDLSKSTGEAIRVKSAIAYPSWQDEYDVGVLVLDHAASVKPRPIASACSVKEHFDSGTKVRVVGFGLTDAGGSGENTKLNEAMLPVHDATCTDDPGCQPNVAPNGEFTAGGMGVDSCFGDSGGPLFLSTDHGEALIGVVSRGEYAGHEPCGGGGVYVRADAVVSWIEKTTGRKVARSACDSPADGPSDQTNDDMQAGGCSVGRGQVGGMALLGLVVLAVLAFLWRNPSSPMSRD